MCLQKYREKVPHLSYGKKDLINNVFVPEENFNFPEIIRFFIFYLFAYDFPTKFSRFKNLFSQPIKAWQSAVFYFRAKCEHKKNKTNLLHELYKTFIFKHGLK